MLHPYHTEKQSHHSAHDNVWREYVDQYGQIHSITGQGFRGANIYEQRDRSEVVKVFIESFDPSVREWVTVWESRSRKHQPSLEEVIDLRDVTWPRSRVVQYVGSRDGDGVRTIYPPIK